MRIERVSALEDDGQVTYPTTWTFALDERTTHMSMTSGADFGSLVFAKPDTVDGSSPPSSARGLHRLT
jgi:hypothetical protein